MTGDPAPFMPWNDVTGYLPLQCGCHICTMRHAFHFDLNQPCLDPEAIPNRLHGAAINAEGDAI